MQASSASSSSSSTPKLFWQNRTRDILYIFRTCTVLSKEWQRDHERKRREKNISTLFNYVIRVGWCCCCCSAVTQRTHCTICKRWCVIYVTSLYANIYPWNHWAIHDTVELRLIDLPFRKKKVPPKLSMNNKKIWSAVTMEPAKNVTSVF